MHCALPRTADKERFVGMIWMKKTIKELDIYISDGNYSSKYPRSEEFVEEGIPFIRSNNMVDGDITDDEMYHITPEKHSILLKGHVKAGDVLITTRGNIGQVAIVPDRHEDSNINAQIVLLRTNQETLYNRYLLWALQSREAKEQYLALQTGTALKQLPVGKLEKLYIEATDINKQHEIADVFDKTYKVIKLRRKELQLLDDLIKARFVEMFGDPIVNEKGWMTKPLLDMGQCKNGMNFHYDDKGIEINCLGVGNFKNLSVIDNTEELPTVSLNEMPSEEYLLKDDDIVFVRSNGNKALVGRSLAVYPGDVPTTFSGFCIRYRKYDNEIIVPYLLRVLKTDSMRVKMTGRGANIQNLNQQILGTLVIPVPPIELQEQFANFVKQVDKSKVAIQAALDKSQLLFDSLMQKYFG